MASMDHTAEASADGRQYFVSGLQCSGRPQASPDVRQYFVSGLFRQYFVSRLCLDCLWIVSGLSGTTSYEHINLSMHALDDGMNNMACMNDGMA